MNDAIRAQLSAFVDGELPGNEAELLLRRMSQDTELRREVSEYLAIGRFIRAEPGLAGADRLHQRIAAQIDAQIDDKPTDDAETTNVTSPSRSIRPLAGAAIAATVALVAIFALQQSTGVDELPRDLPVPVANDGVPNIDAQQDRQRQYFLNHAETSSQFGGNRMNSRVVTLRLGDAIPEEAGVGEPADQQDDTDDMTNQP